MRRLPTQPPAGPPERTRSGGTHDTGRRALLAVGGVLALGAAGACAGSSSLATPSDSASAIDSAAASSAPVASVDSAAPGGGASASGSAPASAGGISPSTAGGGATSVVVGGANFTEQQILTSMYAQVLQKAGLTVTVKLAESREIYEPPLEKGQIDVVPEYAATFTSFLATGHKVTGAAGTPSSDIAKTVAVLKPLAAKYGITVLSPSRATDQNTFVVSAAYAGQHGLKTLSDLGKVGGKLTIASGPECAQRPFCAPGLKATYGIDATVLNGGAGVANASVQAFQAVKSGKAQLALAFTSDGSYKKFGLVELADDKGLQASDDIVPVVNSAALGSNPKVAAALDGLSAVLTTADLQTLNAQVGDQRQQPSAVATAYLKSKNLL